MVPVIMRQDFEVIERLANKIWISHYTPIIGKDQVAYMLEKFQSVKAMQDQIMEGFKYYIITLKGSSVGYIALKPEIDTLFLSKIYVLDTHRGKGIGRDAMAFVENKAHICKLKQIRLTVNIHNTKAINVYENMGFHNNGPIVADIGNGFVMDDYEMIKVIN